MSDKQFAFGRQDIDLCLHLLCYFVHVLIRYSYISVPENDDVLFNIEKLRSHLGWHTNLPRHGPDCRKAMENISNIPKLNPQVPNFKKTISDICKSRYI